MTTLQTKHAANTPKRLLAGVALGLLVAAGLPSAAHAQTYNSAGWTILQPAEDTRFVFVSSSQGDDRNSGRSPAQAVRTIARAKQAMRDGKPDWMLLRRGDTWNESFGVWNLSGRSVNERVVIASFGESDERPKIVVTDESVIGSPYQQDVSHVAIVGLHMEANRPGASASRGIRWLSTGKDLLIEDCLIDGFKDNITVEGQGDGFSNVAIRRNIIVDSWSSDGHSQGIFLNNIVGALMEENVIDHNGWNDNIPDAGANTFKQNVYVQRGVREVIFRGNITSRAAAAGVQLRSGAIAENNLMYANPMGMRFGYPDDDNISTGVIRNNVVLGGPLSRYDAGFGIWTERLEDVEVTGNVIAHAPAGNTDIIAFTLGGFARNVLFEGNVTYGWNTGDTGVSLKTSSDENSNVIFRGNIWAPGTADFKVVYLRHPENIQFDSNTIVNIGTQDRVFRAADQTMTLSDWNNLPNVGTDRLHSPTFVDPSRDLGAYARELGFADETAFLNAARQLSRRNWRPELTAAAAADWIRAGYALSPN